MNEKIKVEFQQFDNVLCGRVLEMPNELRNKGTIIMNDHYGLISRESPELNDKFLYLRGRNSVRDNTWFCYDYYSSDEATRAKDNIKSLIEQWNEKNTPILDNIEKEYLKAVIKPFKNKIWSICKKEMMRSNLAYIEIECQNENNELDYISFPAFKIKTKYKGMKSGKKYGLKDLGLE